MCVCVVHVCLSILVSLAFGTERAGQGGGHQLERLVDLTAKGARFFLFHLQMAVYSQFLVIFTFFLKNNFERGFMLSTIERLVRDSTEQLLACRLEESEAIKELGMENEV